jgi:hypothetical protein
MRRLIVVDQQRQGPSWDIVTHVAAGLLALGTDPAPTVLVVPAETPDGLKAMRNLDGPGKRWMTANVLYPACRLYGLTTVAACSRAQAAALAARAEAVYPADWAPDCWRYRYTIDAVTAQGVTEAGRLPVWEATPAALRRALDGLAAPAHAPVAVITLRQAAHEAARNSNASTWSAVAAGLASRGWQTVVIPDAAAVPSGGSALAEAAALDADLRAALYRIADLCLGVLTGPMILPMLSDLSWLVCKPLVAGLPGTNAADWGRRGVEAGGQLPWAGPRQRILWDDDSDPAPILGAVDALALA